MLEIIKDNFPGAECLIEIMAAWFVKMTAKSAGKKTYDDPIETRAAGLVKWGVNSGRELEAWSDNIRFIEEWFVARWKLSAFPWHVRVMFSLLPVLSKSNKVVHVRFA